MPIGMRRQLDGVQIHRSKTLITSDLDERRGLLVTNAVRTLIDLAPRFREPLLGVIVDEGTISGLWTPETVMARLDQRVGSGAGWAKLRRVLGLRLDEGRPDSPLEQRMIRVVKPAFPGFEVHHRVVLDGEVIEMDIAWVREKIDAEVDGMFTRARSRSKFERTALRPISLQGTAGASSISPIRWTIARFWRSWRPSSLAD
jgi:hypothetical protein